MPWLETPDQIAQRIERESARSEAARQAADDRASEPRQFECTDCGAERIFGRRCDCGSYKLREIVR